MYAIVEDCETTRALLMTVVKGIIEEEVSGFSSAESFFRELRVKAPDLSAIFLDINLPGITGIELIQAIKTVEGYKDVPIVICSASNDRQVIVTALKAGAVNFVIKPFSRQQIKDVIEGLPQKEIPSEAPVETAASEQVEESKDDLDLLSESAEGMMGK